MGNTATISHRIDEREGNENIIVKQGYPSVKITHNDVFNWEELYLLLRTWLIDEDYVSDKDAEFPEVFFAHYERPAGKEVRVMWRPWKDWDKSGLYKGYLDIDIHILFLKDVEVIVDGKKKKAEKGEISIEIRPQLLVDFSGWKDNAFLEFFKHFIVKWFYRSKFNYYKKEMFMDLLDLQSAIKAYLKLGPSDSERDYFPVRTE